AMLLNLAIWVGAEMQEYMTEIGRMLPQYQGNDSWMLPIPATFVIGKDGRIKARFVDPDYRKRMAIDELIDPLKYIQFVLSCQFPARNIFIKVAATAVRCRPATP